VASIPVGRVAGTNVSVSYAVFFAAAAVFGAVAVLAGRAGNSDLVQAALTGSAVWISALIVQLAVTMGFAAFAGLKLQDVTIGLVGVELPVHRWNPDRTALLIVFVIQVLVAMGFVFWLIGAAQPSDVPAGMIDAETRRIGFTFPSLGFGKADQAWQASAWLVWFQTICQILPIPRTLGRVGLLAGIGLLNRSIDVDQKIRLAHRMFRLISLAVLLFALSLSMTQTQAGIPVWFLVAILSALLWGSATGRDSVGWLDCFAMSGLPDGAADTGPTLVQAYRDRTSERKLTKKLQQAQAKERAEAVDASRLDDILKRLQSEGLDSLSADEKATLKRVSATLRKRED